MFSDKVGELFLELSVKKGDLTQALASVQGQMSQTVALAAKYRDFMMSPQGAQFVQQSVQAGKLMNQANAVESWNRLVATQGKSGAMLTTIRGRLGEIGQHLGTIANAAPLSFGGAVGMMERMAAAASPAVWSTFTGSLELLAAVVGQQFTPVFITASIYIQRFAHWIQTLPQWLKSGAAGFFVFGVGVLGAVGSLAMLAGWLARVIAGLQALRALQAGMGLAGAMSAFMGSAGASAGGSAAGAGLGGLAMGGGGTAAAGGMLGGALLPVAAIAAATAGAVGTSYGAYRGISDASSNTDPNKNWLWHAMNISGQAATWGGYNPLKYTAMGTILNQAVIPMANRAFGMNMPGLNDNIDPYTGRPDRPGRSGAGGLATNLNFQSSFGALDSPWRNLQQTAASMSPLKEETISIHNQVWEEILREIARNTAHPQQGLS